MQRIVDLTNIFAPIILSGQLPVLPVCFASFRQILQVKQKSPLSSTIHNQLLSHFGVNHSSLFSHLILIHWTDIH